MKPIRFTPPESTLVSRLLGDPPRPTGLGDDDWNMLRGWVVRRDRALLASLVLSAVSLLEVASRFGDVMSDEDTISDWLDRFAEAATVDGAAALVAEAIPSRRAIPDVMVALAACADPRLVEMCLGDPEAFLASVRESRAQLERAEEALRLAKASIVGGVEIPDHVPDEWRWSL